MNFGSLSSKFELNLETLTKICLFVRKTLLQNANILINKDEDDDDAFVLCCKEAFESDLRSWNILVPYWIKQESNTTETLVSVLNSVFDLFTFRMHDWGYIGVCLKSKVRLVVETKFREFAEVIKAGPITISTDEFVNSIYSETAKAADKINIRDFILHNSSKLYVTGELRFRHDYENIHDICLYFVKSDLNKLFDFSVDEMDIVIKLNDSAGHDIKLELLKNISV